MLTIVGLYNIFPNFISYFPRMLTRHRIVSYSYKQATCNMKICIFECENGQQLIRWSAINAGQRGNLRVLTNIRRQYIDNCLYVSVSKHYLCFRIPTDSEAFESIEFDFFFPTMYKIRIIYI